MIPLINRPSMYRGKLGEITLAGSGLALMTLMLFFGFRLFWDNGFWGLLQLLLTSLVAGALANIRWLQNGITPLICTGLGIAQAFKTF
jgi:hypothetical protein